MATATAPSALTTIDLTRDLSARAGWADDGLPSRRPKPGWKPITGCIVSYFVLALLAFYPIGPFDTRHIPLAGPGNPAGNDPFQMTWFLSYVPYALTHGLSLFHTNFIDYPRGVNLADNTSVPLLGILGWPITSTLGPVATFNFLLRISFALSGASMFLVLRRWCSTWQAPFIGGLLYAFGPYMAAQELHLDLIFVPIPPLLVLFGDELIRRQRMSPRILGLLIGLAAVVQFLTSPDVLSGCMAIALIIGVGITVRFRSLIRSRIGYIIKAVIPAVATFVVLAGYPIYEMVLGPEKISGPVVQVALLQSARADLLGVLAPTSNQLAFPHFINFIGNYFVGNNLSENGTYLGIPLLIVLFVIVRRLRRDATVMIMLAAAISAWVISLGGHLVIGTWPSPLPLPGDLLAHLPLFNNTIPARYGLYVLLFVSMIVAIGIERLWLPEISGPTRFSGQSFGTVTRGLVARGKLVWTKPRPAISRVSESLKSFAAHPTRAWTMRSNRTKLSVIAGIVVLSVLPNVPFASGGVPWPAALPSTVESVVPQGTVVLTVPFATPESSEAMTWPALDHMDFRIVGGYANIADPGESHGMRQPPPLPPWHVQEIFSLPKLGSLLPYVPPAVAESQLLTYLRSYSVGAIVFSAMGANTSEGYWYLIDTLGQPQIVRPGFAIWLASHGKWPALPVG